MSTADSVLFFGWMNKDCKKILTMLLGSKHKKLISDVFKYFDGKDDADDEFDPQIAEETITKLLKAKLVFRIGDIKHMHDSDSDRFVVIAINESLDMSVEFEQCESVSLDIKSINKYFKKYNELCEQYPDLDKLVKPKIINILSIWG